MKKKERMFQRVLFVLFVVSIIMLVYYGKVFSFASAQNVSGVFINEIMYDPEGRDTGKEWIELYNNSENDIDLTGYELYPDGIGYFVFPEFTLAAGSYAVVHVRAEGENTAGDLYQGVQEITNNMGNTSGSVALFSSEVHSKNTIVSFVQYGARGQTWEQAAVDASLWTKGEFAFDVAAGFSLAYDGQGSGAFDWQQSNEIAGTLGKKNTVSGEKPPSSENNIPQAHAGEDRQANVGEEVVFDGSSSFDEDGDALAFLWDFDDGQGAKGMTVTHAYEHMDEYVALLMVSDGIATATDEVMVTVVEKESPAAPPGHGSPPSYSFDVIINELLPNPEGSDSAEWIELKNSGSGAVDLADWQLSDATGKKFLLAGGVFDSLEISAGGYFIVPRSTSKIALNNDGDTVFLYWPDGTMVDQVRYEEKAESGVAWARDEKDVWQWTTEPTRGTRNVMHPVNQAPDIEMSVEPGQAKVGEEFVFDATDSFDEDGDALTFLWDFGDGTFSRQPHITHAYTTAGAYSVVLEISDDTESVMRDMEIDVLPSSNIAAQKQFLLISELLPNPKDSQENEWIELMNNDEDPVDVAGWRIQDNSGRSYTLEALENASTFLFPGEFYLISRKDSKIALNNSGIEVVSLYNPQGILIDVVSYEGPAPKGKSWSWGNGAYAWAEPTPLQENSAAGSDKTEGRKSEKIDEEKSKNEKKSGVFGSISGEGRVIINELMPSPQGDDRAWEYIELKNKESYTVSLAEWQLADARTTFIFDDGDIILPHGFFIVERKDSRIILNNTGDTVFLIDRKGVTADTVAYGKAPLNQAWARNEEGAWEWSGVSTPGEENMIVAEDDMKTGRSLSRKRSVLSVAPLSEMGGIDKETGVRVSGVVAAVPGILGSQIMYIVDEQGGVQLFMFSKDWPKLSRGDRVEIEGVVSSNRGEPRIKIKNREGIRVVSADNAVAVHDISAAEVDESLVGTLATLAGVVIEKSGRNMYVGDIDQSGETKVVLPARIKDLPTIQEGDTVEITGIVRRSGDELRVYPRDKYDITRISVAGYSVENNGYMRGDNRERNSSPFFLKERGWKIAYSIPAGFIALLIVLIYRQRKRSAFYH